MPLYVRVDNGRPLGDPKQDIIPALALWLIGMGIKVIWNPPARPQKNGKVERSQGVMARWTEFEKCSDQQELQERLLRAANFHNFHFPIRRLGGKTRIETYPDMLHTGRIFRPSDFKLNRVLIKLKRCSWERKVSYNGQISHYGKRFSVGTTYRHQIVSIKIDARKNSWQVFAPNGRLIRIQPTPFSLKSIWNLDF